MSGLSLDIAANTRAAQANVRDLSKALDETSDALDDVAKDGGRSADKLEASFRDMTRASEKASRDITRDARDTARDAERAYRDMGDEGGNAFGKIKDGAGEVQQEIGQNLGEAVSSIRGDITELGQVGQDTLGGLAATLASAGPAGIVGAAALAAGAVGLGLVTAEMEKQQEQADALRDRLSAAYSAAADEGLKYIDTAAMVAEAQDLMFNPDRADEWKQIQEDINALGLDRADVLAAHAGDLSAQEEILGRINALMDEQSAKPRQNGLMGTAEWDREMKALESLQDRWGQVSEVSQEYADKLKAASELAAGLHEREREQIGRTADAAQKRYEGLAEQYGKPIRLKVEADTSAAERKVDAMRRRFERSISLNVTAPSGRQLTP